MSCPVCKALGLYALNIAMWLDEGVNVVVLPIARALRIIPYDQALGVAHYTVSQYTAYAAEDGSRVAKAFCWVLTKVWGLWIKKPGYSHCYDAIHYADGTEIPRTETSG